MLYSKLSVIPFVPRHHEECAISNEIRDSHSTPVLQSIPWGLEVWLAGRGGGLALPLETEIRRISRRDQGNTISRVRRVKRGNCGETENIPSASGAFLFYISAAIHRDTHDKFVVYSEGPRTTSSATRL